MKTACIDCGAEILQTTSDANSGRCAICGRTHRAIIWRRSPLFIWVSLVTPALLILFAVWQLIQQPRWTWIVALIILVLLLVRNFRIRTSTEPPLC